jgi:xanthine dehydrogenase accessory factor
MSDRRMACALVVLVQTTGSTPREVGAKMIVTESECFGSIGGGAFEYGAIKEVRQMLRAGGEQKPRRSLHTWHLGADVGQCCGGACIVYLETLPPCDHFWLQRLIQYRDNEPCVLITSLDGNDLPDSPGKMVVTEHHVEGSLRADQEMVVCHARNLLTSLVTSETNPHVVLRKPGEQSPAYLLELFGLKNFRLILFGAGHVGKAILRVMCGLSCLITWVDARPGMFPASVPPNVETVVTDKPEDIIDEAHPGTFFLVMTHSHPLDLELCEQVIKRRDFGYLGLIGSKTKRMRFEKRLVQMGLEQEEIRRLTCPIGLPEITGKDPGAIAISVAAQILQQWNTTGTISGNPRTLTPFITQEDAYQFPKIL